MSRSVCVAVVVAVMCCASVLATLGPHVCARVLPAVVLIACVVAYVDSGR